MSHPKGAGPTAPLRVLIADDHPLMRTDLMRVLAGQPALAVVGVATDGRAAVGMARQLEPDVVLMDIRMPRMDGLQATREITRSGVSAVVLMSTYDPEQYRAAAEDAGAVACVSKLAPESELVAVVLAAGRRRPAG